MFNCPDVIKFGEQINRYVRIHLGKSIRAFAEEAGVSPNTVQRIRMSSSRDQVNPTTIEAFARAGGMTVPQFNEWLALDAKQHSEPDDSKVVSDLIAGVRALTPEQLEAFDKAYREFKRGK